MSFVMKNWLARMGRLALALILAFSVNSVWLHLSAHSSGAAFAQEVSDDAPATQGDDAGPGSSGGSGDSDSGSGSGGDSGQGGAGGSESEPGADPDPEDPDPEDPKPEEALIRDLGIFKKDSDYYYAFAVRADSRDVEIAEGETLELDYVAYLTDDSETRVQTDVEWKSSDESVFTVSDKGVVKALKKGEANLTATVPAAKTASGAKLQAKVKIIVTSAGGGNPGSGEGGGDNPGDDSGDDGDKGDDGDDDGPGGTKPEKPTDPETPSKPDAPDPKIEDLGIFLAGTSTAYAYATRAGGKQAVIDTKGGTLNLECAAYWNDGSVNRGDRRVTWQVSDPTVASIDAYGTLTARSNGTTQVMASIPAEYSATGKDMVATATLKVTNQISQYYVSRVRISVDGSKGATTHELVEPLSTALVKLYALVDVVDSATGITNTYSTADGAISDQVDGVADIVWSINDANIGTVEESMGLYRPKAYTQAVVTATCASGRGDVAVKGTIKITTSDPEGGEITNENHAQDSLRVVAYWETKPPSYFDNEEDAYVVDKTYSVGDMEGLGTVTMTYTALATDSYYTMTGRGVPLATLLADAGIKTSDVKMFAFGTADALDRPVSASFVFDTNRYYLPNIDINSYAEAQQVYPILALESSEVRSGATEPNYDMNEYTRFRLLFGARLDGSSNSMYQIKWINTLYVVLSGGPSVEDGDGDGGDGDDDGSGDAGAAGGGGGGNGTDAGGSESGGTQSQSDGQAAAGTVGIVPSDGSGNDGDGADETGSADNGAGEAGYNIFQMMSNSDSQVEKSLDYDNPWRTVAVPLAMALLLFGAFESVAWFRRQQEISLLMTAPRAP